MLGLINPSLKLIPPQERSVLISNLEKVIKDCQDQLIDLRISCAPHYYELSQSGYRVICIGCGDTHLYNPKSDKLYNTPLPTIKKAPNDTQAT